MGTGRRRNLYGFDEERLIKWQKERRGQGEGVDYTPWLFTRNVKSLGRKHRVPGTKIRRVYHLMSDLERNAFFVFEWADQVTDIQEQFPLDRERTRRIAREMGVPHPRDPTSRCDIMMTTDFLVTFRRSDGRLVKEAFSVKATRDLLIKRTLDKQEIERRYWVGLGFKWNLWTESRLRERPYIETLRWLRDWFHAGQIRGHDTRSWENQCRKVLAAVSAGHEGTLADFIQDVEAQGGFGPGEILSILRHLAARKKILFNPRDGIPTLAQPAARFWFAPHAVAEIAA